MNVRVVGSRSVTATPVALTPPVFDAVRVKVTVEFKPGVELSTIIASARSTEVAGSTYVYGSTPLVCAGVKVFTANVTPPAACGGVTKLRLVVLEAVAGKVPPPVRVTVVSPATVEKFVPVIVTVRPPAIGPRLGTMVETVGRSI